MKKLIFLLSLSLSSCVNLAIAQNDHAPITVEYLNDHYGESMLAAFNAHLDSIDQVQVAHFTIIGDELMETDASYE